MKKEGKVNREEATSKFFDLVNKEIVSPSELDEVWASLDSVKSSEILAQWKGADIPTGHPLDGMLGTINWYGKRFISETDCIPLLCSSPDGSLYSNKDIANGEASLWNEEFRGEVTATMVYDGIPVHDHFKKVDDNTLMGIMNGKIGILAEKAGIVVTPKDGHYYFVLRRAS